MKKFEADFSVAGNAKGQIHEIEIRRLEICLDCVVRIVCKPALSRTCAAFEVSEASVVDVLTKVGC